MTMLAVVKSRAQALELVSALRAAGVPAQSVSTPKEANVGCGVSVRFEENFFPRVKAAVAKGRYSSFAGYMRAYPTGYSYL